MHRLRFLVTVSILVILVVSVSPALAQGRNDRDGDGVPNDIDLCPDEAGPPRNEGCPVSKDLGDPGESNAPAFGDADGDGLTDDIDFCPQDPGPAENGGCPLPEPSDEPEPAPDLAPLPAISPDGRCVVATLTHTGVNIRLWPTMYAQVVDVMSAYELYPVAYLYTNADGLLWYAIPGGFVASWATRIGGICEGLAAFSVSQNDAGETAIVLNTSISVPLGFTPDSSTPDEPAFTFSADRFPFPDMPPDPLGQESMPPDPLEQESMPPDPLEQESMPPDPLEHESMPPDPLEQVLLAQFGPDAGDLAVISTGLLLPAIQQVQQAATESGETQHVALVLPASMFEFTPGPDASDLSPLGGGAFSWAGFSPRAWAWGNWPWAGFRPLEWAGVINWWDESWGDHISLERSNHPAPQGSTAFLIVMMIEPGAEESTMPVDLVALGMPGSAPELCDSSVKPTTEKACLYTSETGDSALCVADDDGWVSCIYGAPALPAVQDAPELPAVQ